MDVDRLSELEPDDRWLVLLGRIASEAVNMEARLRALHAQLHHAKATRETLFAAPDRWGDLHRETRRAAENLGGDPAVRTAVLDAIAAAYDAYGRRNDYIHQALLRQEEWDIEQAHPETSSPPEAGDRLHVKLHSTSGLPTPTPVTLEQAHRLVEDLIGAGWRLQFARLHLAQPGQWRGALTGHVRGTWDGYATIIGDDDDESGG